MSIACSHIRNKGGEKNFKVEVQMICERSNKQAEKILNCCTQTVYNSSNLFLHLSLLLHPSTFTFPDFP